MFLLWSWRMLLECSAIDDVCQYEACEETEGEDDSREP